MDRFRFRSWDSKRKEMSNLFHIFADSGAPCMYNEFSSSLVPLMDGGLEDCVVMQCTGLKDKNGKLIYEGDILKYRYDALNKWTIALVVWFEEWAQFTTDIKGNEETKGHIPPAFFKNSKIVGNIHENPELLKE